MKYCSKCGKEHFDEAVICVGCGCLFEKNSNTSVRPMKWYKFLIYFFLFVAAFSFFVSGLSQIIGATIGENFHFSPGQKISEFNKITKPIDIVYGILLFGLCALAIITRQHLAKYKRSGPVLFYIYYGLSFALSHLHSAIYYIVAQETLSSEYATIRGYFSLTEFIISLIFTGVFLLLNYIYFNKRQNLFVN